MAELIAIGTAATNSADFTLAGETSCVFLTGSPSIPEKSAAVIEIKSAAGAYVPIGSLTPSVPLLVLAIPGVFRVTRTATGASVGVDRY